MLRLLKHTLQINYFIILNLILISHNSFANQSKFDSTNIERIDIKAGEICIVCDLPINSKNGIGFLFKGRKVTLDIKHIDNFFNNPDKYFYKLQAKVVLYDEAIFEKYQTSYIWFIIGLWIFFALLSSAICANLAMKKGLSYNKWFYIGLLTNLFGLIFLILLSKEQSKKLPKSLGKISLTEAPMKCANCDQFNHPKANKCASCGIALNPSVDSEVGTFLSKLENFNDI